MDWNFDLYMELKDLVYSIEALDNHYYDTHDLYYIEENRGEIESKIDYLTENLPLKNTEIGDYSWDFTLNKMVYLDGGNK